jgi:PHP family Zn ribbon phosphoesterase
MDIIADLHLHSRFARAVSPKMGIQEIARWCSLKGIDLAATGDWTHPQYFEEVKAELEEVGEGIFMPRERSGLVREVRFALVTELSCVYRENGRGRRVHHLIFSPSLAACERLIASLTKRGCNLASDGRAVIPLSSRELLEEMLAADPRMLLVPAHVWTPWFGSFGSKTGYDSLLEAFGDLAPHITTIETGLSADPAMCWQVPELQGRTIVSFSDAHSGPKIGREATVLRWRGTPKELAYNDLLGALRGDPTGRLGVGYTIEFFPEEGKYHWTGHRAHHYCQSPQEDAGRGTVCPVCGKALTIGVENRVMQLAGGEYRPDAVRLAPDEAGLTFVHPAAGSRPPFVSLVPLLELVLEAYGSPTKSQRAYDSLVAGEVSEFDYLLRLPIEQIAVRAGDQVAEGIRRMRAREVAVQPGYDGEFGKVSVY